MQKFAIAVLASAVVSTNAIARDFSAVAGKVCRGYYNQAEGGSGYLERPESAFKTGTVDKDGTFALMTAKAAPGASRGWDTHNGNGYWLQGSTAFKVQSDGSWLFNNPAGSSRYYLTYVGNDAAGIALFTIRYEHQSGSAVGKASCSAK